MHYSNGEEVLIGDVIKCEEVGQPALYGVVIGGYVASEDCNLQIVSLTAAITGYCAQVYFGAMRDSQNKATAAGVLAVMLNSCVQSKHSTKIGHIDGVQLTVTA